jgi:hypothetical protein
VPELGLDHHQRHSVVRHLDRVRVTQLMGREPPPHACPGRGTPELFAGRGHVPVPAGGPAADHAQQPTNGQLLPQRQPRIQL